RPTERRQERGREEDVPLLALRPLVFDQPDDCDLVEVAVACRLIVNQVHARRAGSRLERLIFYFSSDLRRQLTDRDRRVIMHRMSLLEGVEDLEHSGPP